jgi:hypothetical protein
MAAVVLSGCTAITSTSPVKVPEVNGTYLNSKTPVLLGLINGFWWGRAPPKWLK